MEPVRISRRDGRRIWLEAQRLHLAPPFGTGPAAVAAAVQHLGYVQIDTIHVIERCHHHILATRIPGYRREDLHHAQTADKSVFEYWTHALAYVPAADYRFFRPTMRRHRTEPHRWFRSVKPADLRRVIALIRRGGPLSIRDIDDEVLVDKDHPWASRKPSKRALQRAFFDGTLTVSERVGMLKTYELTGRYFGWERPPKAATEREIVDYLVARALRSQGIVSVDSVTYGIRGQKPAVRARLDRMARRSEIMAVRIEGSDAEFWATPNVLEPGEPVDDDRVHILSPFDPLVIQRDRLELFFGYRHLFEAYLPPARRRFGYFALPVLVGDRIAAAIDLKTDRERGKLLIQRWTPIGRRVGGDRRRIEEALEGFERFQLGR